MQSRITRLIPNASMAVALLALFVALGGSAYAGVKLSKNSVTSSTIKKGAVTTAKIKNRAVTHSKVKRDTLTGLQINEASLTGVNAATLAGSGPGDFVPAKNWVHFNVPMNRGDAPRTLAKFGSFTLTGHCDANGATNFDYKLTVTSDSSGAYNSTTALVPGVPYEMTSSTNVDPTVPSYTTEETRFIDTNTGFAVLDGDGEPLGLYYGYPDSTCRYVGSFLIP